MSITIKQYKDHIDRISQYFVEQAALITDPVAKRTYILEVISLGNIKNLRERYHSMDAKVKADLIKVYGDGQKSEDLWNILTSGFWGEEVDWE